MTTFLVNLLDLILLPFSWTTNIIIFIPTACMSVIFVLSVIKRLM